MIVHPNAPVGYTFANRGWIICTVDSIMRSGEPHPHGTERAARIILFIDNFVRAIRCPGQNFSGRDPIPLNQSIVIIKH